VAEPDTLHRPQAVLLILATCDGATLMRHALLHTRRTLSRRPRPPAERPE